MLNLLVLALATLFAPLVADEWELVWSDEFTGTILDPTNWTAICEIGADTGNDELQCYTQREDPSTGNYYIDTVNQQLVLVARSEPGYNCCGTGNIYNYTSAKLTTKLAWQYCKIEIRAKPPKDQGIWPAIWMLQPGLVDPHSGVSNVYGLWAAAGEIDIMETINRAADFPWFASTLHFGGAWQPPGDPYGQTQAPQEPNNFYYVDPSFFDDFHVFTFEWDEDLMTFYIDGVQTVQVNALEWFSYKVAGEPIPWHAGAPFDVPYSLIFNIAVGGNFPGPPDGSTVFPQYFYVDYVKVYKKSLPNIQRGNNSSFQ
ncbi:MAG: glycoside hydrolase family 16 protein [Verrucomicrobia bacterium]|nr:glycoside hydrolase family 16 protein [Verrucomicrobiota bacterium]